MFFYTPWRKSKLLQTREKLRHLHRNGPLWSDIASIKVVEHMGENREHCKSIASFPRCKGNCVKGAFVNWATTKIPYHLISANRRNLSPQTRFTKFISFCSAYKLLNSIKPNKTSFVWLYNELFHISLRFSLSHGKIFKSDPSATPCSV